MEYWLGKIIEDYWRLLEIIGDYWRLLKDYSKIIERLGNPTEKLGGPPKKKKKVHTGLRPGSSLRLRGLIDRIYLAPAVYY